MGNSSLDGTKIHADASQSQAVSYPRLGELEAQLRDAVPERLTLGEAADQGDRVLPAGLVIGDAIPWRQERRANLAQAKAVLAARAQERSAAEQAAYAAQGQRRPAQARRTKRKPGGGAPQPPPPGARAKAQDNCTDPDSRRMKNRTDTGVDQHYNAQLALRQASRCMVGHSLSKHPNDPAAMTPTVDAISPAVGQVEAAAAAHGYFSPTTRAACRDRPLEPDSAPGREPHPRSGQTCLAHPAPPPSDDASPKGPMAYPLPTESGLAIERLRQGTVEPVIGIIQEIRGFPQFA